MTRTGLIFRVTRVQPLSGMVFEVVARLRRKKDRHRRRRHLPHL